MIWNRCAEPSVTGHSIYLPDHTAPGRHRCLYELIPTAFEPCTSEASTPSTLRCRYLSQKLHSWRWTAHSPPVRLMSHVTPLFLTCGMSSRRSWTASHPAVFWSKFLDMKGPWS